MKTCSDCRFGSYTDGEKTKRLWNNLSEQFEEFKYQHVFFGCHFAAGRALEVTITRPACGSFQSKDEPK